jgi:hypothetical protein
MKSSLMRKIHSFFLNDDIKKPPFLILPEGLKIVVIRRRQRDEKDLRLFNTDK